MPRIQSIFTLTLLATCLGAAEVKTEPTTMDFRKDEPVSWYIAAATAPSYAKAMAHEPNFADQALWNDDARRAAYAKQVWPKTRVLVWAKPGTPAKDGWDAKYWLEDGKPATKPFDSDSDLVLPDGGGYMVSLTDGRKYQPSAFRHLTIGKNACVSGHFSVKGNLWVKAGGRVMNLDSALGGGDTFWRFDNLSGGWDRRGNGLVDHFHFKKDKDASAEFIGIFYSEDNWQFHSGTFIVASQSEIGMGNRTPAVITKDAAVAIMSGGYLTRRSNCDWSTDLTVEGKLLAGLPERPLTSDARLGLGWKSKGSVLGTKGGGRSAGPHDYGMIVAEGGSLTVHSSDPNKARLLINCSKRDNDWGQISIISRGHPLEGEPAIAKLKELPRLTDMVIKGEVTWGAICLDDILLGGIQVKTKPALKGKDAPTFGNGNAGKPEELFSVIK